MFHFSREMRIFFHSPFSDMKKYNKMRKEKLNFMLRIIGKDDDVAGEIYMYIVNVF